MQTKSDRSATAMIGYAAGMGLVAIALIGIPLQFAYPDTSAILTYGASFVLGGAIGLAVAAFWPSRL